MVMKALHTASLVSTVMTVLLLLAQSFFFPDWAAPLWEKTLIFLIVSYAGSLLVALYLAKKEQDKKDEPKQ